MKGGKLAVLFALGAAAAGAVLYFKRKREIEESLVLEYDFTDDNLVEVVPGDDVIDEIADEAQEQVEQVKDKTKEKAEEIKDKIVDKAEDIVK